jgi:hypothetical protein
MGPWEQHWQVLCGDGSLRGPTAGAGALYCLAACPMGQAPDRLPHFPPSLCRVRPTIGRRQRRGPLRGLPLMCSPRMPWLRSSFAWMHGEPSGVARGVELRGWVG